MKENELDNFYTTIGELCTDFIETQEEFIFQTVNNWLSKNYMTVVSKKELIGAVTLYRTINEYGLDINQLMISANAYVDGYSAGRKIGRQEVIKEMIDTFKEDTYK